MNVAKSFNPDTFVSSNVSNLPAAKPDGSPTFHRDGERTVSFLDRETSQWDRLPADQIDVNRVANATPENILLIRRWAFYLQQKKDQLPNREGSNPVTEEQRNDVLQAVAAVLESNQRLAAALKVVVEEHTVSTEKGEVLENRCH